MATEDLICRHLGLVNYQSTFEAMQEFTQDRQDDTPDEIWVLQHEPVYTLGRKGNRSNLINVSDIPVVQVDRGGDVTYHGPGQLVLYLMADIKRLDIGVREVVSAIEQSIVDYLALLGIESAPRADAPGVYVGESKIASLGLRISRGRSYHGLALNLDMDMSPWSGINACDLGVPITQVGDLLDNAPPIDEAASKLSAILARYLGYSGLAEEQAN